MKESLPFSSLHRIRGKMVWKGSVMIGMIVYLLTMSTAYGVDISGSHNSLLGESTAFSTSMRSSRKSIPSSKYFKKSNPFTNEQVSLSSKQTLEDRISDGEVGKVFDQPTDHDGESTPTCPVSGIVDDSTFINHHQNAWVQPVAWSGQVHAEVEPTLSPISAPVRSPAHDDDDGGVSVMRKSDDESHTVKSWSPPKLFGSKGSKRSKVSYVEEEEELDPKIKELLKRKAAASRPAEASPSHTSKPQAAASKASYDDDEDEELDPKIKELLKRKAAAGRPVEVSAPKSETVASPENTVKAPAVPSKGSYVDDEEEELDPKITEILKRKAAASRPAEVPVPAKPLHVDDEEEELDPKIKEILRRKAAAAAARSVESEAKKSETSPSPVQVAKAPAKVSYVDDEEELDPKIKELLKRKAAASRPVESSSPKSEAKVSYVDDEDEELDPKIKELLKRKSAAAAASAAPVQVAKTPAALKVYDDEEEEEVDPKIKEILKRKEAAAAARSEAKKSETSHSPVQAAKAPVKVSYIEDEEEELDPKITELLKRKAAASRPVEASVPSHVEHAAETKPEPQAKSSYADYEDDEDLDPKIRELLKRKAAAHRAADAKTIKPIVHETEVKQNTHSHESEKPIVKVPDVEEPKAKSSWSQPKIFSSGPTLHDDDDEYEPIRARIIKETNINKMMKSGYSSAEAKRALDACEDSLESAIEMLQSERKTALFNNLLDELEHNHNWTRENAAIALREANLNLELAIEILEKEEQMEADQFEISVKDMVHNGWDELVARQALLSQYKIEARRAAGYNELLSPEVLAAIRPTLRKV